MTYAKIIHGGAALAGVTEIGRGIWNFATVYTPVPLVFGCAFAAFAFWRQCRSKKDMEYETTDVVDNSSHDAGHTAAQLLPQISYRIYYSLTAQSTQDNDECCLSSTSNRKPKEMETAANLDSADDTATAAQVSCEKEAVQLLPPLLSPQQQLQNQQPQENMQVACKASVDPKGYGAVLSDPFTLVSVSDTVSSSKPPDDKDVTKPNMNSDTDCHRIPEFARISEEDPVVDPACTRSYCPAPIGRRRSYLHNSDFGCNEAIAWPSPLLAGQGFCSGAPPSPASSMATAVHSPASSSCSGDSGFSLFTSNKFC
ncbi:hypothetical protein COEREDRAFT_82078 [Coemansia reversa NRRL 1564]|uniref:Uncharacterized protein n=1 Tax=Coemansia reversa (strain ATCC 12441 / NRRL 1564) TaxID=763665 RepID=A0A2G5B8J2_COERN|nr:hypothetical protein COEREDRAFT_82078 [Coemansia reversa NRRL 1564]|eukprot:PIA15321.1 hypothetical protein COEREDRAFT_82078 [Coemansia reversa NRRL 1564]